MDDEDVASHGAANGEAAVAYEDVVVDGAVDRRRPVDRHHRTVDDFVRSDDDSTADADAPVVAQGTALCRACRRGEHGEHGCGECNSGKNSRVAFGSLRAETRVKVLRTRHRRAARQTARRWVALYFCFVNRAQDVR